MHIYILFEIFSYFLCTGYIFPHMIIHIDMILFSLREPPPLSWAFLVSVCFCFRFAKRFIRISMVHAFISSIVFSTVSHLFDTFLVCHIVMNSFLPSMQQYTVNIYIYTHVFYYLLLLR